MPTMQPVVLRVDVVPRTPIAPAVPFMHAFNRAMLVSPNVAWQPVVLTACVTHLLVLLSTVNRGQTGVPLLLAQIFICLPCRLARLHSQEVKLGLALAVGSSTLGTNMRLSHSWTVGYVAVLVSGALGHADHVMRLGPCLLVGVVVSIGSSPGILMRLLCLALTLVLRGGRRGYGIL